MGIALPEDFAPNKLSHEEGLRLIQSFSEEEVKMAVWECDSDKSPGPDGFNFSFYKACWEIIKSDLMKVMGEFHRNGKLTRGTNASFIVLIPKRNAATDLNHYRPISLIGSLYKMLAKILARRMRGSMEQIIGKEQSAFIKGRNILDGVVILNEIIEEAKMKRQKRLFFKVDFSKAYDTMDWGFLKEMMERFNFPDKWITWIMECVSSASANVLVNGSPSGEFSLGRGVRQGDPLSPFLFLLVAEALNLLIKRAVDREMLWDIKVGREQINISHIQYADDTIFAVDGKKENVRAIKWLLKNFEMLSGLSVNYNKCCVLGINMEAEKISDAAEFFGCQIGEFPISYLGMRVGGNLRGAANWEDTVEKVRRRLAGWNGKALSLGGRITLINSVLTALPLYRLSFFPMPRNIEKKIRNLQRSFLWG